VSAPRCSYTALATDGTVLRCAKAAYKGHPTCRTHSRRPAIVGSRRVWDDSAREWTWAYRSNLPPHVNRNLSKIGFHAIDEIDEEES